MISGTFIRFAYEDKPNRTPIAIYSLTRWHRICLLLYYQEAKMLISTSLNQKNPLKEIMRKEKMLKIISKIEREEQELIDQAKGDLDEVYSETIHNWFLLESFNGEYVSLSYFDEDQDQLKYILMNVDYKLRHIMLEGDQYLAKVGRRDENWYFIFVDCISR